MKPLYKLVCTATIGAMALTACRDFDDINVDPMTATASQSRVEYAINNALTGAQQDPHIAERIFCLSWMNVSHMADPATSGSLYMGRHNDGWLSDYYRYLSEWLSSANLAIDLADTQLKEGLSGDDATRVENMKQVARVWRAYLMSEFADCFGPMPVEAFKGSNPTFNSLEEVYMYMLRELKEAREAMKPAVAMASGTGAFDRAYAFDMVKWQRYATSMRMRLAMRLSEVAPEVAKREFEEAVRGEYIATVGDNFAVQERDGWDPLAGVMTRQWDDFALSATVNNLLIGLGGIASDDQLPSKPALLARIKAADYMGVYYDKHYSLKTNDPAKGLMLDGLPKYIDPRGYSLFFIPGNFDDPDYCKYPTWNENWKTMKQYLWTSQSVKNEYAAAMKEAGTDQSKRDAVKARFAASVIEVDATYSWHTATPGVWSDKGSLNDMRRWAYAMPGLKLRFRNSQNKRIFFASWESYFLIAEAAVRGWSVPMTAEEAYNKGIEASFAYHGLERHLSAYLASEAYNNVGTSVKFSHTAEPPASKTMKRVNGYTKVEESYTYTYPVASKTLYGKALNDKLTKIITQKYLANMPWLPLEAWNDQRRLGLPFFETPAAEETVVTMPSLTGSNYDEQKVSFFPQRFKYPSSFMQASPNGYAEAVKLLGGEDAVSTPLWWAKH